jgi:hypothetical protein
MSDPPVKARGQRRTLWLLLLAFFAPLLGSFWLYYGSSWRPAGHTNHGELIEPPRQLPQPAAPPAAAGGTAAALFMEKWSLVYVGDGACDADCRAALLMMRQTHASLGRLAPRVQQLLLASSGCCDREFLGRDHPAVRLVDASGPQYTALLAAFPRERRRSGIFIVDPLGNLMMRYDTGLEPRGLLQDLKKLLELSHIG